MIFIGPILKSWVTTGWLFDRLICTQQVKKILKFSEIYKLQKLFEILALSAEFDSILSSTPSDSSNYWHNSFHNIIILFIM